MGNFSDPLDKLKNSLPQSFLNSGEVQLEPAWLAKVARGGTNLTAIKSSLTEHAQTYMDGEFPDSLRPAKYAADVAQVVQDTTKTIEVLPKYTQYVTQAKAKLDEQKAQATSGLEASKTRVDESVNKISGQAGRKARLYGNKAKETADKAKETANTQIELKKELVSFE
jgi:hypothetical protein